MTCRRARSIGVIALNDERLDGLLTVPPEAPQTSVIRQRAPSTRGLFSAVFNFWRRYREANAAYLARRSHLPATARAGMPLSPWQSSSRASVTRRAWLFIMSSSVLVLHEAVRHGD